VQAFLHCRCSCYYAPHLNPFAVALCTEEEWAVSAQSRLDWTAGVRLSAEEKTYSLSLTDLWRFLPIEISFLELDIKLLPTGKKHEFGSASDGITLKKI
jgi:hypothetical protein